MGTSGFSRSFKNQFDYNIKHVVISSHKHSIISEKKLDFPMH